MKIMPQRDCSNTKNHKLNNIQRIKNFVFRFLNIVFTDEILHTKQLRFIFKFHLSFSKRDYVYFAFPDMQQVRRSLLRAYNND